MERGAACAGHRWSGGCGIRTSSRTSSMRRRSGADRGRRSSGSERRRPSPGRSDRIPGQEGSHEKVSLGGGHRRVRGVFSRRARGAAGHGGQRRGGDPGCGQNVRRRGQREGRRQNRGSVRGRRGAPAPQPGNDPGSRRHSGVLAGSHRRRSERPLSTTTHVAASGNVAYEAGTYQYTIAAPGAQPVMDRGKYVVGFRKDSDGKWRMAHDAFNSDMPCPPAAPPAHH